MTQHVSDIMTSAPVTVEPQTSVTAVARIMRDQDLGAVLVTDGDELRGLVTDRDLVVRSLADGGDPNRSPWPARASRTW
ncbi:Oxidoreductase OS=Streptomyces griseorubiginosus OX=67304 GN=AQJ54_21830 PE=4 SV=1 [Streptomyces griseorubiginosus]